MPRGGEKLYSRAEISRRWRLSHKEQCAANARAWRKRNPEKTKEHQRRAILKNPNRDRKNHYKKKYGITIAEYDILFAQQEGRCCICRKVETAKFRGRIRRLAVEHDHRTGKVRGLTCNHCNVAIMWKEAFDRYEFRDEILAYLDGQ